MHVGQFAERQAGQRVKQGKRQTLSKPMRVSLICKSRFIGATSKLRIWRSISENA